MRLRFLVVKTWGVSILFLLVVVPRLRIAYVVALMLGLADVAVVAFLPAVVGLIMVGVGVVMVDQMYPY